MNKPRRPCTRHAWKHHAWDWSMRGIIAFYRVAVYRCVHCGRHRRTWGKHRWELEAFEQRHPIAPGGSALAAIDAER
ncbi:MAG: hypothetical protein OXC13_15830 [Caldilineaceae bacterium]|nr:hypothetical protein [Caldilineaceae bacterium]